MLFLLVRGSGARYRRSRTRTRRTLRMEFDYGQVTLQLSETTSVFVENRHTVITVHSRTIFSD